MGGFHLSETRRVLEHRCHLLPRAPLHSAPADVFALIPGPSDPMGPNLLSTTPFKMLHLWTKQGKPTQGDHPDSSHRGAWDKSQLPGDTPQGYSFSFTCQHISVGSPASSPEQWPAPHTEGQQRGRLDLGTFSHSTGIFSHRPHTWGESRNLHQLKSFFESRGLLAQPKNFTCQRESVSFSKEARQVAEQMLCRKSPRCRGATCQPSIASSQCQPFSASGAENGAVLLLPAVSQTLKHPTDTSLSALQLFKESLSVYY